MSEVKHYRNEWKYEITNRESQTIKKQLNKILKKDVNSNIDGSYFVRSLYFDDYDNNGYIETDAGISKRHKYRIRYYNNDTKSIKLECKEKNNSMCYKDSCLLTINEYKRILSNDFSLFWETDKSLIRKFLIEQNTKLYKPVEIIDYQREAYVDNVLNIRITIDKNISSSFQIDKFLSGLYDKVLINENEILEIKAENILPRYIVDMVNTEQLIKQSYSKYYLGRKKMQNIRGY